ncbi:sodium:proton antiporter NhaD, partial [Methylobacter sp.]|uniref:sodium:proton antiporter NhaD n=1 Tax=Methylobacter sp. TaxID=2051955 RepID=UPI003DA2B71E
KSKPMLLASALIWAVIVTVYQQQGQNQLAIAAFRGNLQTYMELLLFIMVSMTYLNAMEDMRVFEAIKFWLVSKHWSYRRLFWITGFIVFFISRSLGCIADRLRQ